MNASGASAPIPLRLDTANAQIFRGEEPLRLGPKAFALLSYLAAHHGQLVTKEELFLRLWPDTVVSDGALAACIREIRRTLDDDSAKPRYIETVHWRGYRFIGALERHGSITGAEALAPSFVGREMELDVLGSWLKKSKRGARQVVFVTGEAGIGKTTLVEAFLRRVAAEGALLVARGQCVEQYGPGEAYLPWLTMLGQITRELGKERLFALLRRYAPTWLVQLPWLVPPKEREPLQREALGATRERMLRELAEALEALAAEAPLGLVLEDLHWSDHSSLDLLSFIARRRESARLMIIATYRPVEVILSGHPLKAVKQELKMHRQCEELTLEFLTESDVALYLEARCPGLPANLNSVIYRRTDGNPLFMVNVVDSLIARSAIVERGGRWELTTAPEDVEASVPDGLRQMIESQIERLHPDDQRVLGAASVAGAEFLDAVVAAGLGETVETVEERLDGIVRRGQFVVARGRQELPDGSATARYAFVHALYQNVLYERMTAGKRLTLHRRIGERMESAYGSRTGEIAAELAVHFERARDYDRAVNYLKLAGENAIRRSAYIEAIALLARGLDLLGKLPESAQRKQRELALHIPLGNALMASKGYASREVERVYSRARELCRQVGETEQLFPTLYGLFAFHLVRANHQTAYEIGKDFLPLAEREQSSARVVAHRTLALPLLFLGKLVSAREHFEQIASLYDPRQHRSFAFQYGQDPGMAGLTFGSWARWLLGYPDQALEWNREAIAIARESSHPHSLAYALVFGAMFHQMRRDVRAVEEWADAAITLCDQIEMALWRGWAIAMRGWTLTERGALDEGIAQIQAGLDAVRATGAATFDPYILALLAEAGGSRGQLARGLTILDDALNAGERTGERYYEAEIYRLKGELLSRSGKNKKKTPDPEREAEACFRRAIEIARGQQAKSLELRAVISLSRLLKAQGKAREARSLPAEVYGWFTEGFDTSDLKEAKELLRAQ
jgi:predicted ATPase/DNA-binding winged helix-turn-helix (wHTH) protein